MTRAPRYRYRTAMAACGSITEMPSMRPARVVAASLAAFVTVLLLNVVLGVAWQFAAVLALVWVAMQMLSPRVFEHFFVVDDDPKPGSIHRRRR